MRVHVNKYVDVQLHYLVKYTARLNPSQTFAEFGSIQSPDNTIRQALYPSSLSKLVLSKLVLSDFSNSALGCDGIWFLYSESNLYP
jgi:hypothetical protein